MAIQVAESSNAKVWGRSLAEIPGSNPVGGMDVLCIVRYMSLWRADPSSREILPNAVCHCVYSKKKKLKNEAGLARVGLLRQMGRGGGDIQDRQYR
jgi:hypothetical protein